MRLRLPIVFTLLLAVIGIAGCDAPGYRRSGGQWAYGDARLTPEDARTFEPLDDRFARDAVHGYYRGSVVPDSDGRSFTVVGPHEARDRNHVWYCDTSRRAEEYWSIRRVRMVRIEGADAATYVSIGRDHARDSRRVYYEGRPFAVRDPATFMPLDGGYARDSQRGYHDRIEIPGSDGPSFRIIDERDPAYARDRTRVYHGHLDIDTPREPNQPIRPVVRILRGAEPDAVRVLGRDYAADSRRVWHRGLAVAGADPATFAIDATYQAAADATDRSGAWQQGKHVVASK